jgi:Fe-S cluster biogenesis protein NfuA
MPIRRRILTFVFAAVLALAIAVMPANAGGGNNVVIVENSTAGATLVDSSTQVIPVPMDSVTSGNVAIAINSDCVGCHSTAVAVQILIVRGSPSNFAPGNAAAAVNGACDSCGAYAYARQHWIQTSSNAHLSGAVRQQIAQIREEISTTATSILPSDAVTDPTLARDHELDAKLDALTAELIQVVKTGLEESGADATVLQDNVEVDGTTPSS